MLNDEDRVRLSKLLGLLGSDFDGERANAAALATRFLRERNLTWNDLVRPPPPPPPRQPEAPSPPPRGWIDFKAVARDAMLNAHWLVPRWLPEGRRFLDQWECGTLAVNLVTGRWWCSNTNARGYDLISLRAWLDGTNQGKAARRIMREIAPC